MGAMEIRLKMLHYLLPHGAHFNLADMSEKFKMNVHQ